MSCIIKERQRQINPVGFPVVQDKMEPVQIYFIQRTIWNIVNFRNDTNLGYICKKKKTDCFWFKGPGQYGSAAAGH